MPSRRNCWTCGYCEAETADRFVCNADEDVVEMAAFWWLGAGVDENDMPPRETPTPCPGWRAKEGESDAE